MSNPRLVVVISGRGSNLLAIIHAIQAGVLKAEIVAVISNKAEAKGLELATKNGIKAHVIQDKNYPSRAAYEVDLITAIKKEAPDLVILAGYMKILGPEVVAAFKDRILNIHPSLLPDFKGLHPQRQALEAGVSEAGCTVHLVDDTLDGGPILAQAKVEVFSEDTEQELSERILIQEHRLYPKAIANYLQKLTEKEN